MKRERIPWWTTGAVLGGLLLLSAAAPTGATVITWATPVGSTNPSDGKPVSAQADFTTGTDSLTILLTNLQANPNATVELPAGRRDVTARAAVGEERDRLWGELVGLGTSAYTNANARLRSRETAIVILEPARHG